MSFLGRIQLQFGKLFNKTLYVPAVATQKYYSGSKTPRINDNDTYVVDMRTDCLTEGSSAMKQAMAHGTLGDDVFNEDPTVHQLQNKVAEMFGMEASLFVPSGTMGNLISVLCHCNRRGLEVLFGHMTHLIMFEQGGVAQLGGLMPRTIPNNPDGTFNLEDLDDYIRPNNDPHQPLTGLITVENTHSNCGGKVLPLDFLAKLRQKTNELGLPLHMDGARVFNAAVALDVEVKEILQHVDSVSVCLSKGVGAPIGSMIGGSAQLVAQAVRLRKVLGGGWRQPGPLAAAALVSLSDHRQRIAQDHKHAKMFAQGMMEKHNNMVHIDIDGVHSNIVMINILKPGLTAAQFCDRLNTVTDEEMLDIGQKILLLVRPARMSHTRIRCVLYSNIGPDDILAALKKWNYVLEKFA